MVEANHQTFDSAYAHGRARWPNVPLDVAMFRKHVQRLQLSEPALLARAEDLYVVAAVLEGVPNATAGFEKVLWAASTVAARVDRTPVFIDDVKQELRVTLLTGSEPKLRTYLATGALLDWLRVVVVRLALNMKRGNRSLAQGGQNDGKDDGPAEGVLDDQDAQQFKRWYLEDMHGALKAGFERLSPRERTLMRLHFIDGLNIERMGVIYGVHRATVARWLITIRQRLFDETKARLAVQHGLDTADVKSIYRVMEQDVHLSMSRILSD